MRVGEIVGFVSKSELERLRLIREARAIYDSIFPATDAAGELPDEREQIERANNRGGRSY